jgi:transcription initiation factor TFIIE subunit alpha
VEKVLKLLELKTVRDFVKRAGGEYGVDVLRIMAEAGEPVTDEYIAGFLGVKVTVVRTVLNRFHFWGIVDYDKERDPDTGWYTYTWKIRIDRMREAILKEINEKEREIIEKLEELESFMFFECPKGHERVTFEVAMEMNFTCPVCGGPLKPVDVEKEKGELREQLTEIARIKSLLK